jgi:hypothetical protein
MLRVGGGGGDVSDGGGLDYTLLWKVGVGGGGGGELTPRNPRALRCSHSLNEDLPPKVHGGAMRRKGGGSSVLCLK